MPGSRRLKNRQSSWHYLQLACPQRQEELLQWIPKYSLDFGLITNPNFRPSSPKGSQRSMWLSANLGQIMTSSKSHKKKQQKKTTHNPPKEQPPWLTVLLPEAKQLPTVWHQPSQMQDGNSNCRNISYKLLQAKAAYCYMPRNTNLEGRDNNEIQKKDRKPGWESPDVLINSWFILSL